MWTASGGTSYLWSTSVPTAEITISTADTYTVTVTDANGCTASTTKELNVNDSPVATITGKESICAGESSVFTAIGSGTYVWNTGSVNDSIMVSIGGVYTVTVTNVNGCKGVAEKTLSVILLPNAGLDASVNCYLTGSATMSANGVGEWKLGLSSVGNATIDSTTNPNTTVNGFSEAGTYIMIWSNGICQDSISIFVDDICDCPIENNFISDPSQQLYCGAVSNIYILGSNANPNSGNYVWEYSFNNGDFNLADGVNKDVDYVTSELGEGIHMFRRKYIIETPFLCIDSSNIVTIEVVNQITSPFNPTFWPNPICLGDTVYVNVEGEVGALYNWKFDGASSVINNNNSNFVTLVPKSAGTFNISVSQSVEFCEEESNPLSFSFIIYPKPIIDLGRDTTICKNDGELTLKIGNYDSIEWQDGSSSNEMLVSGSGVYSVVVVDENGCENEDAITIKDFCCEIYYPNIIKQNTYNENSLFRLSHSGCILISKLRIYDRWGNLVYISEEGLEPWDGYFKGQPVEIGVYTFIFSYQALDENEKLFDAHVTGDVTVVR